MEKTVNKTNRLNDRVSIPFLVEDYIELSFKVNITVKDEDNMTLDDLLKKAQDKIKKKNKNLSIIKINTFEVKNLDGKKKLKYYNHLWPFYIKISSNPQKENESLSGGIIFNELKNATKVKFSNSAPDWRSCSKGLNLFAICKNKGCVAYMQEVIVIMGFGAFDFQDDLDKVHCPMCDKFVKPFTCGFYGCLYRALGTKIVESNEGDIIEKIDNPEYIVANDNELTKFESKDNKMVNWITLKIVTLELTEENKKNNPILKNAICRCCGLNLNSDSKYFPCGHNFHKKCLKSLPEREFAEGQCFYCNNR